MLSVVLCLSLAIAVAAQRLSCTSKYMPASYVGYLRIPTTCYAGTPSACPRSWKSGIPEGRAISKPLIYSEFLVCHEKFSSCGYVHIDPRTGDVLGTRGVTIGSGVDLGSKSTSYPGFMNLSRSLVDKLKPYFGLKNNQAACVAIEHPLKVYPDEAFSLTNNARDHVLKSVEENYNRDKTSMSLPFASLSRGIRTVMVSLWYQLGAPHAYPTFWKFVIENNWKGAVRTLRNFYKNPSEQMVWNVRRRNDEADIIEATLVQCTRSIDAVILLDASGSVTPESFAESLAFVKNFTEAFSDEKLRAADGTRLGLSTFSHAYASHFYLSSYKSKADYLTAVGAVQQIGGTTSLGYALTRVADQFSQKHGLRGEEQGRPRFLIVLTDGKSHDNVEIPAQRLRAMNIVIYTVGIGEYDRFQLRTVATSRSHVHTLNSFFELDSFVATLTAAACNEPLPVTLKQKLFLTSQKETHEYFVFKATANSMLKINVTDVKGRTSVYLSRSNPNPYKYDNDMAFLTSSQKNKVLVLSVTDRNSTVKRSIPGREITQRSVYVAVFTNTVKALFTVEGVTCDPLNCSEGTNEVIEMALPLSTANYLKSCCVLAVVIMTCSAMFV